MSKKNTRTANVQQNSKKMLQSMCKIKTCHHDVSLNKIERKPLKRLHCVYHCRAHMLTVKKVRFMVLVVNSWSKWRKQNTMHTSLNKNKIQKIYLAPWFHVYKNLFIFLDTTCAHKKSVKRYKPTSDRQYISQDFT